MKNWWLFIFLIMGVWMVGCQQGQEGNPAEMNAEDLPDVRAFQDEFTRSFLQSTEETREGYYPFLSGTGAYEMDFPAGGIVGEKGYGKVKEKQEGYSIGILDGNGMKTSIDFKYDSYKEVADVNSYIDNLRSRLQIDVEFKEVKSQNDQQSYHYTSFERNDFHTYAGYIQNNASNGGIQVVYQLDCKDTDQLCEKNKQEKLDQFIIWLKSIEYINKNGK